MTTEREARILRILLEGDRGLGCWMTHLGSGSPDCPREAHHHHDEFCGKATDEETRAAKYYDRLCDAINQLKSVIRPDQVIQEVPNELRKITREIESIAADILSGS